jgi:hypothetical protein
MKNAVSSNRARQFWMLQQMNSEISQDRRVGIGVYFEIFIFRCGLELLRYPRLECTKR